MSYKTIAEDALRLAKASKDLKTRRIRLITSIKAGIIEAHMSMTAVGKLAGVSHNYLSQLLNGKREGPAGDKKLLHVATKLVAKIRKEIVKRWGTEHL